MYLMALWSDKVRAIVRGRKATLSTLQALSRSEERIWVHVASLGEFEQARPLIESYRERHPEAQIVLSFFSSSGYRVRKDYDRVDAVVYLPADTHTAVRKYLDTLNPSVAIFVKYDFWPTMITELGQRGIKTYLIAAIFRKDQVFFQNWGGWYRNLLHFFACIYVQDTASAELLRAIGVSRVQIAGDTRIDRVQQIATSPKRVEVAEWLRAKFPSVLVAGSTWPADNNLLMQAWGQMDNYGLIMAPHELEERYIDDLISQAPRPLYRLSTLERLSSEELEQYAVAGVVIDCIGLLSSLYQYATVGYIGGGFGKGIHNSLEAAVYGIPILFGPRINKFREAKALVSSGAAWVIHSSNELEERLRLWDDDPTSRIEAGRESRAYVERELGATDMILQGIEGDRRQNE